ncbi:MAG: amidohydrolase family protein [Gaiellaceae bacterium]
MTNGLLVEGGSVVAGGTCRRADVLVEHGQIVALGEIDPPRGVRRLDAGGCLVLPGGVDVHAHVFGRVAEDTRSALHGGTTTVVSFMPEAAGERPAETARRMIADEIPDAAIDIGIHGVIWEPDTYHRGDLAELADLGVTSVKLWLAYRELGIMADDAEAFAVMREAADEGVLVQAHCENGYLVDALRDEFVAAGRTELRRHGEARPPLLEAEAVNRFLAIARLAGADAYVVHVSGAAALEEIARARALGDNVFAEACPHHLAFDDRAYESENAARYLMTPPLRTEADQQALWAALQAGALETYASDHSHLTLAEKLAGGDDFTLVEPGVPGVEARLPIGFTLGVESGLVTPERLVEAACTAPARIFGLYPRKGAILPGADGDIVVWDPTLRWTLTSACLHDGLDYTPYEGMTMQGAPRAVVVGGEAALEEGQELEQTRSPDYLARERRRPTRADSRARI